MQIERASRLYLFIAYFVALNRDKDRDRSSNDEKRDKYLANAANAAKYAKQLDRPTPSRARVGGCVCVCACQGHDDNCAKNILPKHSKRDKQSGKPKDNKCCRQILSTSRLLSHGFCCFCCGRSSFTLLLLLLLLLSSLLPDPFIIFPCSLSLY